MEEKFQTGIILIPKIVTEITVSINELFDVQKKLCNYIGQRFCKIDNESGVFKIFVDQELNGVVLSDLIGIAGKDIQILTFEGDLDRVNEYTIIKV